MMRTRRIGILMVTAMFLLGVGIVSAGIMQDEIMFEERPVRLIFPEDFDPGSGESFPLVLHLHGAIDVAQGANPADIELDASGYRDLPSQYRVIVAAPTALVHPFLPIYFWNAAKACCAFDGVFDFEPPDDVGFLNRLLDKLLADYPIDPKRIYIYGYSNGGWMAHRMACEAADRIAAIIAGAGVFPANDPEHVCTPSMPVSVLHFHSRDDEVVPFNGGNSSVAAGVVPDDPVFDFPGAIETVVRWAALNQCTGVLKFGTEATLDLDVDVEGNETTINQVTQCPEGIAVELWSMVGVDHPPLSFGVGPNGIKTLAEETWKFLQQHTR